MSKIIKGFSNIKDVDLSILIELNDHDLLSACLTNKYIYSICQDDQFWRKRLIKRFGESYLKYKVLASQKSGSQEHKELKSSQKSKELTPSQKSKELKHSQKSSSKEHKEYKEPTWKEYYMQIIIDLDGIRQAMKKQLINDLTIGRIDQGMRPVSDMYIAEFLEYNNANIENGVREMYEVYREVGELEDLRTAENDWYQEFLYTHVEL